MTVTLRRRVEDSGQHEKQEHIRASQRREPEEHAGPHPPEPPSPRRLPDQNDEPQQTGEEKEDVERHRKQLAVEVHGRTVKGESVGGEKAASLGEDAPSQRVEEDAGERPENRLDAAHRQEVRPERLVEEPEQPRIERRLPEGTGPQRLAERKAPGHPVIGGAVDDRVVEEDALPILEHVREAHHESEDHGAGDGPPFPPPRGRFRPPGFAGPRRRFLWRHPSPRAQG